MDAINVKERPFSPFHENRDWRVLLGVVVTVVWFLAIGGYVSAQVGWTKIEAVPLDVLGQFLEGAFAPLAFLWFVLAFFSQQQELAQNTAALKMQYVEVQKSAEQAVIQSEAIRASEQHARRESFLRIAESVKEQLGVILGFLYLSSQAAGPLGRVSQERIGELWSRMGHNDPEVFSRALLQIIFGQGEKYGYRVLYGTAVRTRHSENFIYNFERMLRAAEACDEDGMIHDSLLGSAHGYVYRRMVDVRDHPPEGFTYGVYDFDPDVID
ncbi:MAG TPA: hypothetical protein VJ998_00115 [Pseudomonadales bacterium]|nr:hypothetical protein [Pseudomonadales bacterium]